jgi:hypothetical protein
MGLREIGLYGMNCIHLARERDQWRALLNTVMFHIMMENSRVAERLVVSKGLSSKELVVSRQFFQFYQHRICFLTISCEINHVSINYS